MEVVDDIVDCSAEDVDIQLPLLSAGLLAIRLLSAGLLSPVVVGPEEEELSAGLSASTIVLTPEDGQLLLGQQGPGGRGDIAAVKVFVGDVADRGRGRGARTMPTTASLQGRKSCRVYNTTAESAVVPTAAAASPTMRLSIRSRMSSRSER